MNLKKIYRNKVSLNRNNFRNTQSLIKLDHGILVKRKARIIAKPKCIRNITTSLEGVRNIKTRARELPGLSDRAAR